jgi:hypothetical protein
MHRSAVVSAIVLSFSIGFAGGARAPKATKGSLRQVLIINSGEFRVSQSILFGTQIALQVR